MAALRRLGDDSEPVLVHAARLALTRLPLSPDGSAIADHASEGRGARVVPPQLANDARTAVQRDVDQVEADLARLVTNQDRTYAAALVTAYLALVVERAQPGWMPVAATAAAIGRAPWFQPDIDGLLPVYHRVLDATDEGYRRLVEREDDRRQLERGAPRPMRAATGAWLAARYPGARWLRRNLAWIVARAGLGALLWRLEGELGSLDPSRRLAAARLIAEAAQVVDDDSPPPLPTDIDPLLGEDPLLGTVRNRRSWAAPAGVSDYWWAAGGDGDLDDRGVGDAPDIVRDVQFTVYKPLVVRPERWCQLLAFVHRSTPFVDDDGATVDPVAEVAAQADRELGAQRMGFVSVVADSAAALPYGDELVFEPWIENGEVNPERVVLRWCEPIHRVEFKFRVPAQTNGRRLRGGVRVSLGVLEVANVSFAVNVDRTATLNSPNPPVAAPPYRRIFASYSHCDTAIVQRVRGAAAALGDRYVIDVEVLRAGEQWQQRLAELIEEADVFQLFWSHNSMRSEFVRREWEHALALERPRFVRPLFWEDPRPADPQLGLPPAQLARLHFWRLAPALTSPVEPPAQVAIHRPTDDPDSDPNPTPPPPATDDRGDRPAPGYPNRRPIGGRSARSRSARPQIRVFVLVIVIVVLVLLLAHLR